MRTARLLLLAPALVTGLVGGCLSPARGFCEAHADCSREILGIEIPDFAGNADDSVGVCTVEREGQIRALRANEEEECQIAAEKTELYMACIAAAFAEDGDGCDVIEDQCEDELDDMNDALADIDGNECGSAED
jgi:hypothetical protein